MGIKKFADRKINIFLHIIAWVILFIIPAYLLHNNDGHYSGFLINIYVETFVFALIFYINYFWLVPLLFFKKRRLLYFISAIVLIIIMSFIVDSSHSKMFFELKREKQFDEMIKKFPDKERMHKPSKSWPIYNFILTSFLMTGFSMGLVFSAKLIQNEKERKEAERERLNSELALLKNQVSPHFFFNTLNNIYALIQINTQDAQKAVLQLSKLMRYLLYESEHGNTMLSKEIDFMRNYIDLIKLRINDKVELSVTLPDKFEDIALPPLLFIPFIENSFKHGVSYREPSFINISMKCLSGVINFNCINSIVSKNEQSQEIDSGIGLENVKKRLSLLFPARHILTINKSNTSFEVSLEINLS